jgi:hypothetical protein
MIAQLRGSLIHLILLGSSLLFTACASPQSPPQESLWGAVIEIGRAEQGTAPAIWTTEQGIAAAWIGADDTGVHQDAIMIREGSSQERVVLPLPPVHPFDQQMIPASNGYIHLLWLDANPEHENRLYAALLTPTLQIERGPTLISSALTLHYAAVSDGRGGVWVAWSGRLLAEPELYTQYIDSAGRPRQPNRIAASADWLAMTRANVGDTYLFWLHPINRQIYHTLLENGTAESIDVLGQAIDIAPGDRLMDFHAALDTSYAYLFWNITHIDGTSEAWYTSAKLDSGAWSYPGRLGFGIESETQLNTGFNGGTAKSALSGFSWFSWISPLIGQFDMLPAAAYRDGNLLVVYFRDGVIAGYQTVVVTRPVVGAPALATDQNRHLYLTWSEPNPAGYADLKLTTTRR